MARYIELLRGEDLSGVGMRNDFHSRLRNWNIKG